MNRDDLIREYRDRTASWQAVVLLYAILVGAMIATASAIV